MDSSSILGGGFLSGGSNGGMIIDLESPRHTRQTTHLSHAQFGLQQNNVNPISKGKGITISEGNHYQHSHNNVSEEEDEPSYMDNHDGSGGGGEVSKSKKGTLPWQRMKWTDEVVKLLVAVVACVDDDGVVGAAGGEGLKRKSGVLQKKGKWKTVSKIMITKGIRVSPQQCEDKFNDLNKRYKRLNDILGRGISCRVVENPSLMDSIPNLSPKAKDDVRKILSSKHLFYKEICAYHNGQRISDCHDIDFHGQYEEEEEEEEEENEGGEEEAKETHDSEDEESENSDEDLCEPPGDSFEEEMVGFLEDPMKSMWDRREWVRKQTVRLEEQRVNFEGQALELERQRFRWLRYCSKKDRELERLRLENERLKLENERRVLQLRQKETEFGMRRSEATFDHLVDMSRPQ